MKSLCRLQIQLYNKGAQRHSSQQGAMAKCTKALDCRGKVLFTCLVQILSQMITQFFQIDHFLKGLSFFTPPRNRGGVIPGFQRESQSSRQSARDSTITQRFDIFQVSVLYLLCKSDINISENTLVMANFSIFLMVSQPL